MIIRNFKEGMIFNSLEKSSYVTMFLLFILISDCVFSSISVCLNICMLAPYVCFHIFS